MRTDVYQSEAKLAPMLITAKQAAQLLNISPRYVYTLSKEGRLRAKRIGKKVLYRLSDIQRFIDEDEAA
jgi:excisionase family DNA binding protein